MPTATPHARRIPVGRAGQTEPAIPAAAAACYIGDGSIVRLPHLSLSPLHPLPPFLLTRHLYQGQPDLPRPFSVRPCLRSTIESDRAAAAAAVLEEGKARGSSEPPTPTVRRSDGRGRTDGAAGREGGSERASERASRELGVGSVYCYFRNGREWGQKEELRFSPVSPS